LFLATAVFCWVTCFAGTATGATPDAAIHDDTEAPPKRQPPFVTLRPRDRSVIVLSRERGVPAGQVRKEAGDRIVVNASIRFEPGTYECLQIVVESQGFSIDGAGAVLKGCRGRFFKGKRGPFFVTVLPSANVSVSHCEIVGYQVGVQLFSARGCEIRGNLFRENYYAVVLRNSFGNRVSGNRFVEQALNDISLYGSGENVIRENHHLDTRYDCVNLLAGSHGNLVSGNRFDRNGGEVVGILFSDRNVVRENTVRGGYNSVLLLCGQENRVEHNRFVDCLETVNLELFSSRNRICHNVFLGAGFGLEMEASTGNLVLGNWFEGVGGPGLTLWGYCRENVIANNTFLCAGTGLLIEEGFPILQERLSPEIMDQIRSRLDPVPRGNVFLANCVRGNGLESVWIRGDDGKNRFSSNRVEPLDGDVEGKGCVTVPSAEGSGNFTGRDAGRPYLDSAKAASRSVQLLDDYSGRYRQAVERIETLGRGDVRCFSFGADPENLSLLLWQTPMGATEFAGSGCCFEPSFLLPGRTLMHRLGQRILLRLAGLPGEAVVRRQAVFRLLLYNQESMFHLTLEGDAPMP